MLKRIGIIAFFLTLQNNVLAANEEQQLTQLDAQRNEALNKITSRLIEGKISPDVARQLKTELDDVVKLESHAAEDHQITTAEINNISKCLETACSNINSQTHPTKVWMGINNRDTTLHNKITDALASGKIDKEQARTLEQEYEKLHNREISGYPTNALEFTDAIALADDLQTLNNKINQLIAGTGNVH